MIHKAVLLWSFGCVAFRSSFCNTAGHGSQIVKLLILILFIFSESCRDSNTATEKSILPSNDSSIFFPVNDYFINQISAVDSNATITYIYADSNNRKDSAQITLIQFHELASPFLKDNINDISVKKYYKESIFNDATTASNTFNYTSVNTALPLQAIDILLDTGTSYVKRVFITKNFMHNDSSITEKMGWKTDRSFFINRSILIPGKKETMQQISVIWKRNN